MKLIHGLFSMLALSMVLQGQEDLGALLGRARAARDEGRYEEALKAYGAMLALVDTHETALLERAQVFSWAGRFPEALEAYRQFRSHYPQRVLEADLRIAQVQAWAGDYSGAATTLDPWVRQGQPQAVRDDATYRAWNGRLDESLKRLDAWLKEHGEDREALLLRAKFRGWAGQLTESRQDYMAVADRFPADYQALLGLTRLSLWQGNPTGARLWLERIAKADRGLPDTQVVEAQCEVAEGHSASARERLLPLAGKGPARQDARDLLKDLTDSEGPWIEAKGSRTDTSEGLRTEDPEIKVRLPLYNGHLDLGAVRYRAGISGNTRSARASSIGFHHPFGPRWSVNAELRSFSDFGGSPANTHSLGIVFKPVQGLRLRVDQAKALFLYTPDAIDKRGSMQTVELSAGWTVPDGRVLLEAGFGRGSLSAGSVRKSHFASVERRFPMSLVNLHAGLLMRGFGYSKTLPLGFFNPEKYRYLGFTMGVNRQVVRALVMELNARYGRQTINGDRQAAWGYGLSATWNPVAEPISVFAAWSQSVAGLAVLESTDPASYREHTISLGLRLRGPANWTLFRGGDR